MTSPNLIMGELVPTFLLLSISRIVFYFLSGPDWLTHHRQQFYGLSDLQLVWYLSSSTVGRPSLLTWHVGLLSLLTNIVRPQASLLLQFAGSDPVTSRDSQPVRWSHITLCKYNCWREERRDFTSPLNTNLIFQPSRAGHFSLSSLLSELDCMN